MTDAVVKCSLLASALVLIPASLTNARLNNLTRQLLCEQQVVPPSCEQYSGYHLVELQQVMRLLLAAVGCALTAALLKLDVTKSLYAIVPLFTASLCVYLRRPQSSSDETDVYYEKRWITLALIVASAFAVYLVQIDQPAAVIALWFIIWIVLCVKFAPANSFDECLTLLILTASYILTSSDNSRLVVTAAILTLSSFYLFMINNAQTNALFSQ